MGWGRGREDALCIFCTVAQPASTLLFIHQMPHPPSYTFPVPILSLSLSCLYVCVCLCACVPVFLTVCVSHLISRFSLSSLFLLSCVPILLLQSHYIKFLVSVHLSPLHLHPRLRSLLSRVRSFHSQTVSPVFLFLDCVGPQFLCLCRLYPSISLTNTPPSLPIIQSPPSLPPTFTSLYLRLPHSISLSLPLPLLFPPSHTCKDERVFGRVLKP